MADTAYRSIQSIELDTASNLWSSLNGADEIIIYHHNFQNQAEQLSSFRNLAPEMRAVAVDSQDIYDEFGYGIVGADAIHEFLVYTYNSWQAPAPSYVLLIGDGNYDPKNHVYTRESFIPPYLAPVDPWIGETAADNRYVTLDFEDTFPDMMLGRLAVNSTDEASAFVDKIINYEQNTEQSDWKQRVLFIADNADSDGNFPQSSDDLLECCLPAPYQSEKIYLGVTHPTSDQARSAIQNGINSGNFIVNYIGHASATQWASEGLFKSEDVAGLANDGMLPVMLTMTCYDGYYIYPHQSADGYDSTAEVITRANGKGAIASWSPTGLGVSSGHEHLNQGFFEALFYSGASTLGETTYAGKFNLWSTGNNLDLLDTYLLFGDPAMSMPVIPTTITANDDEYQTDQDSLLTVSTADGVLKNDLGYDGFSLTTVIDLDANHGALSLGGDGSFTYMPEQNWNGTDIYTYRAFDGYKYSNVATVTITVNPLQEKFFIFLPLLFNNTESDITR
ncbi:MAG: C25 family cysteine peptidase [Anaerolineales bacterium]